MNQMTKPVYSVISKQAATRALSYNQCDEYRAGIGNYKNYNGNTVNMQLLHLLGDEC